MSLVTLVKRRPIWKLDPVSYNSFSVVLACIIEYAKFPCDADELNSNEEIWNKFEL